MATPKISVMFVLSTLTGGGAERTFLNILSHLDRAVFKPTLVLYRRSGPYLSLLRDDVTVVELGVSRPRFSVVSLARCIRAQRPDLIISTMLYTNTATVVASKMSGVSVPTIVRETNNQTAAGRGIRSPIERIVRWSYRHADKVVSLSHGVERDLIQRYGLTANQVVTIYNPIDVAQITELSRQTVPATPSWRDVRDVYKVLAVGRLERQKGFDLLIQAAARLHFPWSLMILGQGSEEEKLRALAARLGVQSRVCFPGFQPNPYTYMAEADLFVLSSRWEGFGHVVAEAMACGVPVLATRCPSGPDEIIEDDVDGRLCRPESVSDLTFYMDDLLRSVETRVRYARAARTSVRRFDVSILVKTYEKLFYQLAGP